MDIDAIFRQIHTEIEAEGLPIVTVRDTDGTLAGRQIVLHPDATPEQIAQAEQIAAEVIASQ